MSNELGPEERERRAQLVARTRTIIMQALDVKAVDADVLHLSYCDFYIQVAFSLAHPLMAFVLIRPLSRSVTVEDYKTINELNLESVLGSHSVDAGGNCFFYRTAHWLETELTAARLLEILNRCVDEANRAYRKLVDGE